MRAAFGGSSDFIQVEWGADVLAQVGVRVGVGLGEAAKEIKGGLEGKTRRRLETLAGQVEASQSGQLAEAVSRTRKSGGTTPTGESGSTRPPAAARPSQYIPI